ncbi:hypothetical protein ACHQM5_020662 [Ranunculus cassubicifolius]
MVSKEIESVTDQTMENGGIVFQEENLPDLSRKSTSFVGEKIFNIQGDRYFSNPNSEFRRNVYDNPTINHHQENRRDNPDWNHDVSTDGSDCDEDDDDDDEDDEIEEREEGFVTGNNKNNENSSGSVHSSSDKLRNEKADSSIQKLGLNRGVVKDVNGFHTTNNIRGSASDQHHHLQGRSNHYESPVTLAEPDLYYSHYLQGPERSAHGQKEMGENGCGVSGGKEVCLSFDSGEPLRAILSDPITGALMDDAMILPCGHSFGNGGLQHVIRMKACYTCSQSVTEDSVSPNLSLRYAIEAFRREEELHSSRASKRKRERLDQEKSSCGDLSMYFSRGKGVQFPFAVTDRVIIKGNKRTPLRFVGREAVVTTQCLNGWYVVKTLDNAESVKLQYRSLAKVCDTPSSSNIIMSSSVSKTTPTTNAPPNWL